MRLLTTALATLLVAAISWTSAAFAAPVWLQDYEPPGNLDAPFNLQPHFSGSTEGVINTGTGVSTITHVADDGALGTSASAELFIPFDAAGTTPTSGGWAWQVRLIPNSSASANASNPAFDTDGFLGYFLKVDPSVEADLQTAPAMDDPGTTTATAGVLKPVIKDGEWHRYQWNMDDPADFPNSWDDIFGGGLGDTTLADSASFDAIALVSTNGADAVVRIDQIGFDNEGQIIPEPSSLALIGLACFGLLAARRRAA